MRANIFMALTNQFSWYFL